MNNSDKVENLEFNELEWHDATILDILIDRHSPGHDDRIALTIIWPDGSKGEVEFQECWAFEAVMNFGVVASEGIMQATAIKDHPRSLEIRKKWETAGLRVPPLVCYEIETSSTGGSLRIFAERFVAH